MSIEKEDSIHARFRSVRKALGISQGKMGKLMGSNQSLISQMESGVNLMSARTLLLVNAVFPNINFNYLIRGEEPLFFGEPVIVPQSAEGEAVEINPDTPYSNNNSTEGQPPMTSAVQQQVLSLLSRHMEMMEKDQAMLERIMDEHIPNRPTMANKLFSSGK